MCQMKISKKLLNIRYFNFFQGFKKIVALNNGSATVDYLVITATIVGISLPILQKMYSSLIVDTLMQGKSKLVSFVGQSTHPGQSKTVPNSWFSKETPAQVSAAPVSAGPPLTANSLSGPNQLTANPLQGPNGLSASAGGGPGGLNGGANGKGGSPGGGSGGGLFGALPGNPNTGNSDFFNNTSQNGDASNLGKDKGASQSGAIFGNLSGRSSTQDDGEEDIQQSVGRSAQKQKNTSSQNKKDTILEIQRKRKALIDKTDEEERRREGSFDWWLILKILIIILIVVLILLIAFTVLKKRS